MLATLLLNDNRLVTVDRLVETLWPVAPPRSALGNLYTYVAGLRRLLPAGPSRIGRRASGYSIQVQPHELDLRKFQDFHVRAGRLRAADRPAAALNLLRKGLSLWRGEPLEDLAGNPAWAGELSRLAEERLAAREEQLALLVDMGQYATAISAARELLSSHPFREQAWQQLMLALYHSGRRAEALQTYSDARQCLVDELGVEPGPLLRRTHAMLLADGAGTREVAELSIPSPSQLPPGPADFCGRTAQLRWLRRALSGRGGSAPATVIIEGAPGIGKSALALRTAHSLRAAYPDGQLYADLAGSAPAPRDPGDVLAEQLRALGLGKDAIPASLRERSALLRSRLADRRVLMLLDDAADAAQVCPLLPAAEGCAVLVTSRHRLAALPGAHPMALDILAPAEGRQMLGRIVGPDRVRREPRETAAILHACGHLPLAIRIAGAKLAGRHTWRLRTLAERLADENRLMGELQTGELSVRSAFESSVAGLPGEAARALRLLGMLGSQSLPGWIIDALLGRPASEVLDTLLDAHLLQLAGVDQTGGPRYRLHRLLRAYALQAAWADPPQLRRAALTRALGGWLALAERAAAALLPPGLRPRTGAVPRWTPEPVFIGDPLNWFDAERQSLLIAGALATRDGLHELAAALTTVTAALYAVSYQRRSSEFGGYVVENTCSVAASSGPEDQQVTAPAQQPTVPGG